MTTESIEKARADLIRVVAKTSVGDPAWTIGEMAAELIVTKLEALMDAKAQAGQAPMPFLMGNVTALPAKGPLPDGFAPAVSVAARGQLPDGFKHDTYVEVVHRDGIVNKALKVGMRPSVGEAALFNWKQTGSDDDVVGYRFVAPPENKMAMPKQVA